MTTLAIAAIIYIAAGCALGRLLKTRTTEPIMPSAKQDRAFAIRAEIDIAFQRDWKLIDPAGVADDAAREWARAAYKVGWLAGQIKNDLLAHLDERLRASREQLGARK